MNTERSETKPCAQPVFVRVLLNVRENQALTCPVKHLVLSATMSGRLHLGLFRRCFYDDRGATLECIELGL